MNPVFATLLAPVPGEWSITTLLESSEGLAGRIGGALLGLLGIVAIICAVVFAFSKLTNENSRRTWGRIIVLFLIGGLMVGGSIEMFQGIAESAKPTLEELGSGAVVVSTQHSANA